MAQSNNDQGQIRDYLLGHLSEEEQQRIEERLMVEDDLFEEFEISKGELVEEYRAGELSGTENQWFERHYLASTEGKKTYTFTVALNCLKRPEPQPQPQPPPQQLNWFGRLGSLFTQQRWAVATVSAVLVAAIALVVFFPLFDRSGQRTLAVNLETSTSNRAPSEPKYRRIQVTPDVGEVKIDLMLPESVPPTSNYRVVFDNRSGTTKTLNVSAHDARSVSVIIPATELPPGLYALTLSAINGDGAEQRIGGYFFEVTN